MSRQNALQDPIIIPVDIDNQQVRRGRRTVLTEYVQDIIQLNISINDFDTWIRAIDRPGIISAGLRAFDQKTSPIVIYKQIASTAFSAITDSELDGNSIAFADASKDFFQDPVFAVLTEHFLFKVQQR